MLTPEFVDRSAAGVESLFGIVLTREERSALASVLERAWRNKAIVVIELHQQLTALQAPTKPISIDVRRDMLSSLAGLDRVPDAREYVTWLTAVVTARNFKT